MKKIISLFTAAVLFSALFTFSSCSDKDLYASANPEETDIINTEMTESAFYTETNSEAVENNSSENTVGGPAVPAVEVGGKSVIAPAGLPAVTFSTDKTEVKPGEKLTVSFRLTGADLFACMTAHILYDSKILKFVSDESFSDPEYYSAINDKGSLIDYQGYVATTKNISDENMLKVTFEVSSDVEKGTETIVSLELTELQLGTDVSGDKIYHIDGSYSPAELRIKIA